MAFISHIFYHDDVDGIISAAIFLNARGGRYRLMPVSSSMRGEKFNNIVDTIKKDFDVDEKIVILDYQNHKDADFWVDHHFDPTFGDSFINNRKMCYYPLAQSAASLISNRVGYPIPLIINYVNMIDSASYNGVEQIFTDTSPMMILRAYLEKAFPSAMMYNRMVEVFSKHIHDPEEAIATLDIDKQCVRSLESSAMQIKDSMVICGGVSIVNKKRRNQYPRYSEYLVKPDIKYSISFTNMPNSMVELQIGYNNFGPHQNNINVGKLLTSLSPEHLVRGGGHYNVGGGTLKIDNINKFIDTIIPILNEEDQMEKYAVDSTDPVEAKAAEMIKEGSAKNIGDARDMATKTEKEEIDGGDSKDQ